MYTVERSEDKVIVIGPDGFQKSMPNTAIGVVLRFLGDIEPEACAVAVKDMTEAEAVATALGILNAP